MSLRIMAEDVEISSAVFEDITTSLTFVVMIS